MTPLSILLAAIFLGTGNYSYKIVHGELFSPIVASMFVKLKRNHHYRSVIGIFWDELFYHYKYGEKNLDVWLLFVENEALLTCNFTS